MSHLDEGVMHAVLDGEIPARDLGEIQKHLTECRECQDRFAEARQLRDESLAMIERLDPAPVAVTGVIDIARVPSRPRWRIPTAWAATIIGALGLGYAVGGLQDRSEAAAPIPMEIALTPPSPAQAAGEDVAAETAAKEKRSQPDAAVQPGRRTAALNEISPVVHSRVASADSPQVAAPSGALVGPPGPVPAARVVAAPAATETELKDAREGRNLAAAPSPAKRQSAAADEADRGGAQSRATRRDLLRIDGRTIPNPADQRRRAVSAVAAIAALGGSIRLVDGLTPTRFEQQGEVIRVVYRTAVGTVVLEQWRAGDLIAHELIAPREAPPDSVRAWESRVR